MCSKHAQALAHIKHVRQRLTGHVELCRRHTYTGTRAQTCVFEDTRERLQTYSCMRTHMRVPQGHTCVADAHTCVFEHAYVCNARVHIAHAFVPNAPRRSNAHVRHRVRTHMEPSHKHMLPGADTQTCLFAGSYEHLHKYGCACAHTGMCVTSGT